MRFRCLAISILWTSLALTLCSGQQTESREANAVKMGGTTYFTTKMENLTTKLDLTPDQRAKLKPIAEQEVGLLNGIRGNPAFSRKEKLARLQQIVLDSDKQMRPWLSAEQWEKLQALRKDQKERLKQYARTK
jgi:Spy/CpxP family protein refolding chaperone